MGVLSRREHEVMDAVFSLCQKKGVCVVSPSELVSLLPKNKGYTEEKLESILTELALDNYFQLLFSERQGEKMFVISLTSTGQAYKRSDLQRRRDSLRKIAWAIGSAVIAFLVGVLLKRIF